MHAIIILPAVAICTLFFGLGRLKDWVRHLALLGLLVALTDLIYFSSSSKSYFGEMVVDSPFSACFSGLLIVTTALIIGLSDGYFEHISEHKAEYYALLLFSLSGAIILVSYQNMAMLFLGLEIMSVSTYVLCGIEKNNILSNESALKYFLMGAFFTAVLLLGIAFVYGATGSFNLDRIAESVSRAPLKGDLAAFLAVGILIIFIAMSFKVSVAPFHFWAPDVYDGAPVLVTAYMSTVVKVAGFAAFLRLYENAFATSGGVWEPVSRAIIILTLLIANLSALSQERVKRMLAWSSISHAGYLLIPLLIVSKTTNGRVLVADNATFIYSVAYCLASVAAFGTLIAVGHESEQSFNGLGKRNPLLALSMTIALCSMAGIPLTAGFFGKFYVFAAALEIKQTAVVLTGALTAVLSIYYYFKIIKSMYFETGEESVKLATTPSVTAVVVLCSAASLLLGIFPSLFATFLN